MYGWAGVSRDGRLEFLKDARVLVSPQCHRSGKLIVAEGQAIYDRMGRNFNIVPTRDTDGEVLNCGFFGAPINLEHSTLILCRMRSQLVVTHRPEDA